MLDIKRIRDQTDAVRRGVRAKGGAPAAVDEAVALDEKRRAVLTEVEQLKQRRNAVSKDIGRLKQQDEDTAEKQAAMREVGERIGALDAVVLEIDGSSIELRGPEAGSRTDVSSLLPEKAFQLATVDFNGNRNFSKEEFARFPASPGLRKLDLGQTLFDDRASARVLRGFPSLEELQVPHQGGR